ncbi:MAG: phosphotransferase [Dehalococcoidia bacterium]
MDTDPDPSRQDEIGRVLAAYGRTAAGHPHRVEAGTLNANYRVPTAGGALFLRLHRPSYDHDRILAEHEILTFVAARGIPVPLPLRTAAGGTTVAEESGIWSAYPWIAGTLVAPHALTHEQAVALGDMHGRTQAALAAHPASATATFDMTWDREQSLATLAACAEAAGRQNAAPWVVEAIGRQAELLAREPLRLPADFAWLPCQLAHGDFQDQQALFAPDGSIAAITDWELCRPWPRIWDLVRALAFCGLFRGPALEPYLAAYRRHVTLTPEECHAGMELWWQSRLGSAWVWHASLVEGNARVATFYEETARHLEEVADPAWRAATEARLIHAATG